MLRVKSITALVLSSISIAQPCQNVGNLMMSNEPIDRLWSENNRIEVIRIPETNEYAYYIYGDEINIKRDLPTLVRKIGMTATKVSRLIIDARVVIINDRISISNSSVVIRAQKVKFDQGGVIVFPDPPNKRDQKIDISALTLDFSRSRRTVFQFASRDWKKNSWPLAGGSSRSFKVNAQNIIMNPKAPKEHWLQWHTLDNGEDYALASNEGNFSVVMGLPARNVWLMQSLRESRWPQKYLDRLMLTYNMKPYAADMRRFILKNMNNLAFMEYSRSNPVFLRMAEFNNAIIMKKDLYGFNNSEVSIINVEDQINELADLIKMYFENGNQPESLMEMWDSQWLSTLKADSLDGNLIESVKGQVKKQWSEIAILDKKLRGLFADIDINNKKIKQIDVDVDENIRILEKEYRDNLNKVGGDISKLKVVQTIAVAAAALYPPTAPVAATVAQGLDVTTGSMCGSLQGKSSYSATFDALKESRERKKLLDQQLENARIAYDKQNELKPKARRFLEQRNPEDKESFGNFASAVGEWGSAVGKAVNIMKEGGCSDQVVPDFRSTDDRARALIDQKSALEITNAKLNLQAAPMQIELAKMTLDAVSKEAALVDLQELKLDNEQKRIIASQLSDSIRTRIYSEILRHMTEIKRSLIATGVDQNMIPSGLWDSPDALRIDWQTDAWTRSDEEWSNILRERRSQALKYIKTFLNFANTAIKERNKKIATVQPAAVRFSAYINSSAPDNILNQYFLSHINKSLKTVYRQSKMGQLQSHIPIPIPFKNAPTNQPEYFITASVVSADFKPSKPGNRITFNIYNSGSGIIKFANDCRRMSPSGDELIKARTSVVEMGLKNDWKSTVDPSIYTGGILRESIPFYSPYYITVKLEQPKSWMSPPQVSRLDIDFVRRGPK